MSLRNMAVKLALAFAAVKGVQAYRSAGGMEGVKRQLSEQRRSGSGIGGMIEGLGLRSGAGGGGLLGGLAAMAGGSTAPGDTSAAPPVPQDDAVAGLMIRAMGQAARADGEIDAEERQTLMDAVDEADAAADGRFLMDALSEPVDARALAREVPQDAARQVYAAALMAIDPDHPAELAYLSDLRAGLGLDQQAVASLHAELGKPTPDV